MRDRSLNRWSPAEQRAILLFVQANCTINASEGQGLEAALLSLRTKPETATPFAPGGEPVRADFAAICDQLKAQYLEKQGEYATPDDPWSNFRRVAELSAPLLNQSIDKSLFPMVVAFILEAKQIVGVIDIVGGGKDQPDAIRDKLRDKATYSIIERLLFEPKQ